MQIDGINGSHLAKFATAGTSGGMGLEVRSHGMEAAATFDDLVWTLSAGTETRNYTYDALNRLQTISGAESSTFTYDDLGRLTNRMKDGVATTYGLRQWSLAEKRTPTPMWAAVGRAPAPPSRA